MNEHVSRRDFVRLGAGATLAAGAVGALGLATATPASAYPAAYNEYYKYFSPRSHAMPRHDTAWVPQGITWWGSNKLIISYYDGSHEYDDRANSIISIMSRSSTQEIKALRLNTRRHVGGLATAGGYLWAAMDGRLLRYSPSKLNAAHGSLIYADKEWSVKSLASYAYGDGTSVWVGTCDELHRSTMYRYQIVNGAPVLKAEYVTPSKVQGVAVTPTKIIWSKSWGWDNSSLIVWPRGTTYNGSTAIGNGIAAPPRSEGLTIANGRLQLIYESSANSYVPPTNALKKRVVRSVHFGTIPPT